MTVERGFRVHPEASAEFIEAVTAYEQLREGRGAAFNDAANRALSKIIDAPHRWPPARFVSRRLGAHSCLVKRFPYTIIYRLVGDDVLEVVAFAHQSRRPGYWKKR